MENNVKRCYVGLLFVLFISFSPVELFAQKIPKVFWVERTGNKSVLKQANTDASNIVVSDSVQEAIQGIKYSASNGKIFWTSIDRNINEGSIGTTPLNSTTNTTLLSDVTARGISFDISNQKIFYASTEWRNNKIIKIDYDGSNASTFIDLSTISASAIRDIVVDQFNGKIYWSDFGTGRIQRANLLDGSNVEDFVTGLTDAGVTGLAIDIVNNKIYWTEINANKIKRANLNGSNIETLISSDLDRPNYISIDIASNTLYWTEAGNATSKIMKAAIVSQLPLAASSFITGISNGSGISFFDSNEAPAITNIGNSLVYTVGSEGINISTGINFTDSDDDNLTKVIVKITNNYENGKDILTAPTVSGFASQWDATTGTLIITGVASKASYENFVRAITYKNTSSNPTLGTRKIDIYAFDSSTYSEIVNKLIMVVSSPTLSDIETTDLQFPYGSGALNITSNITVAFSQSKINGAIVSISNNFSVDKDSLFATAVDSITSVVDNSLGKVTFSGSASLSKYQEALRGVKFKTSGDSVIFERTISFIAKFDANESVAANRKIILLPSSPVAIAAGNITNVSFDAKWNSATNAAGYKLDVATDTLFNSILTWYNNKDVGNVTSYSITGISAGINYYYRVRAYNITDTSASSNRIVIITLPAKVLAKAATSIINSSFTANWDFIQGASKYYLDVATDSNFTAFITGYNNRDVGNVKEFSITSLSSNIYYYYRIRGANISGSGASSNFINVLTQNIAPVIADIENTDHEFTEDSAPIAITSTITISDIDNTNLQFAEVKITGNYVDSEDELIFVNSNGITGLWNSATGSLTLSGDKTVADYQNALKNVKYMNSSQNPSTLLRTVSITANDGLGNSNAAIRNINIISVNDQPIITVNELLTVPQGGSSIISPSSLSANDVDDVVSNLKYAISAKPTHGKIIVEGKSVDIFTQNEVNLGKVSYLHDGSQLLIDQFQANVIDESNSASSPFTFRILIEEYLEAPVVSNLENQPIDFFKGGEPVSISDSIRIVYPENIRLKYAKVIIYGFKPDEDRLQLNDSTKIKGSFDLSTGELILTGNNLGKEDFENALRSIIYKNIAGADAAESLREIRFEVSSGKLSSEAVVRNLNVINPLSPPTNLLVNYDNNGNIIVRWDHDGKNLLGFLVEREGGSSGLKVNTIQAFIPLDTLASSKREYIDFNTKEFTKYNYRVIAFNSKGMASDENGTNQLEINITIKAPSNLQAEVIDNSISLSWLDNSQIEGGYIIERSVSVNTNFMVFKIVDPNTTRYKDSEVVNGKVYYYRVTAFRTQSELSLPSNVVDAVALVTSIDEWENEIPNDYVINQNYPNPFNPTTIIRYGLPEESNVTIKIYNLLGQEVAILENNIMNSGFHEVNWNASDLSSGIYIYSVSAKSTQSSRNSMAFKKMILVK